jgi:triacylglycerol lipase
MQRHSGKGDKAIPTPARKEDRAMLKKRPEPNIVYVFHPERDSSYVHFEYAASHAFVADAASVVRRNAWWLGDAALLSYWDANVALERLRGAGMEAEALDSGGVQAYIGWTQSFVIVAFRGTEPDDWDDIFADINIPLVPHGEGGRVHAGFKASLERIWETLRPRLYALRQSRRVWFTGHSLGAALATLAASRYEHTWGVCTFGSPRVGDAAFASAFDQRFGDKALRFVNDADVVTHVPPSLPTRYKHVGRLRHIRPDGSITTRAPAIPHFFNDIFGNPRHTLEVVRALQSGVITTPADSLLDHMPRAYTVDVWNDYVRQGD